AAGPDRGGIRHLAGSARRRRTRPQSLRPRGRRGAGRSTMPRWLAHLLVVVGWVLTPVLGWGASFVGLWVGAAVGMRFANPITMLAIAGAGAALFGVTTLITWLRFMRKVAHGLSHHMPSLISEELLAGASADSACRGSP